MDVEEFVSETVENVIIEHECGPSFPSLPSNVESVCVESWQDLITVDDVLESRDFGYLKSDENGYFIISPELRNNIVKIGWKGFCHKNGPFAKYKNRSCNTSWFNLDRRANTYT